MRFAYLTTDEVNQALALELAADQGVIVHPLAPKDGPPDRGYDAILCDWDSWPQDGRAHLLSMAKRGSFSGRFAVHGYNFTSEEARTFLSNDVMVHRILKAEVLRLLTESLQLAEPQPALAGERSESRNGSFTDSMPQSIRASRSREVIPDVIDNKHDGLGHSETRRNAVPSVSGS
jgi:hypothetical protein